MRSGAMPDAGPTRPERDGGGAQGAASGRAIWFGSDYFLPLPEPTFASTSRAFRMR